MPLVEVLFIVWAVFLIVVVWIFILQRFNAGWPIAGNVFGCVFFLDHAINSGSVFYFWLLGSLGVFGVLFPFIVFIWISSRPPDPIEHHT